MRKITIKKGRHSPIWRMPLLFYKPKRLSFTFRLDPSWFYILNNENQFDISKILGLGFVPWYLVPLAMISPAFFALWRNIHHRHSIRLGVAYNYPKESKTLTSYGYSYDNSYLTKEPILSIIPGKDYEGTLFIESNHYMISLVDADGTVVSLNLPKTHNYIFAFFLNPYFGGNEKAPQDVITYLKINR